MSEMEEQDIQQAPAAEPVASAAPEPAPETAEVQAAPASTEAPAESKPSQRPQGEGRGPRPPREPRPQGERRPGGGRPEGAAKPRPQGERREGAPQSQPRGGGKPEGGQPPRRDNRGERGGPRPERMGRPDGPLEISLESLMSDSLYLDNAAHAVVARMRDMDSGTKSQLRRLHSAVRRACRAVEGERQHQFVMLRARLAYTIARHQLRSLDVLEKLLLAVTRRNDVRAYERFRDLFEAIVAYNE